MLHTIQKRSFRSEVYTKDTWLTKRTNTWQANASGTIKLLYSYSLIIVNSEHGIAYRVQPTQSFVQDH